MSIVISLLEMLWSILQGFLGQANTPELATAHASPGAAPSPATSRNARRPQDDDPTDEEAYDAQAGVEAAQQQIQGWMNDALPTDSPLLAPIQGVSVEKWATVAASLSTLGDNPDAYHRTLAEHDLDAATFEAVQAEWLQRMQAAHDPMAAAAIAQIYGAAFTQTRSTAAPDNAEEPCTLARYAEFMGAQSAWAQDGHDVNAMMKQTFHMTAAEFSDIGAYWTNRIFSDVSIATRLGDLSSHYEEQYRSTDDPDADLVL